MCYCVFSSLSTIYAALWSLPRCAAYLLLFFLFFFFQAEDGIRDLTVTGVQTCALPIYLAFKLELGLVDPLQKLFERFFLLEFRLFVEPALRQHCDKAGIAQPPAELSGERVVLLHVQQERRQPRSLESHAFFGLHDVIFGCAFH